MNVLRSFVATAVLLAAGTAAQAQGVPPPPSSALPTPEFLPTDPMDEAMRTVLRIVVVKPGDSPTEEELGGDYDRETLGLEGGMGTKLGLTDDFMANTIRQMGNYGEIFEANIGVNTTLGLERGLNALWTQGGLMYAAPVR